MDPAHSSLIAQTICRHFCSRFAECACALAAIVIPDHHGFNINKSAVWLLPCLIFVFCVDLALWTHARERLYEEMMNIPVTDFLSIDDVNAWWYAISFTHSHSGHTCACNASECW